MRLRHEWGTRFGGGWGTQFGGGFPTHDGMRLRHEWGTRFGDGELAESLLDGQEAAQMDELEEAELEVEALLLAIAQLVEGAQHDLEEAAEFFLAEEGGGAGGAALLVGGDLEKFVADAFGGFAVYAEAGDFGDERVAQVADALAGKLGGGVSGVEKLVGGGHDFSGDVLVYGIEDALEDGVGDGAHELADLGGVEAGVAAGSIG